MEKITFSLKLFSDHFYGQSFIKTVRGPYSHSSELQIFGRIWYSIHYIEFVNTLCVCIYRTLQSVIGYRIVLDKIQTHENAAGLPEVNK